MNARTEVDARMHRMKEADLRGGALYTSRPLPSGRVTYERADVAAPAPPVLIALTSPAMGAGKSEVARRLVEHHGFLCLKFAGTLKAMIRAFLRGLDYEPDYIERMVEGDLKELPITDLDHRLRRGDVGAAIMAMAVAMLNDLAIDERTVRRMLGGDLFAEPIDGLGVSPRDLLWSLNKWFVDYLFSRLVVSSRWLHQSLGTEWGRGMIQADLWAAIMRIKVEAYGLIGGGRDIAIDDMRFPNELDLVYELGGVPARVIRPGCAVTAVKVAHPSEGGLDHIDMDTLPNSGTIADLHALTDGLVRIVRARRALA